MQLIMRKAAIAENLKFYYTGKPCPRGHICTRRVTSKACLECERINAASYYSKNSAKRNAYCKERRETCSDEVRLRDRIAYRKNQKAILARQAKWRSKNKDKIREQDRLWRSKNQDKRTAIQRNREARTAAGGTHTSADIKEINLLQRGRCGYCRKKLGTHYHVDHIVPLAKGGRNDRRNLQILCVECNQRKWSHDPIEFAQKIGRLL